MANAKEELTDHTSHLCNRIVKCACIGISRLQDQPLISLPANYTQEQWATFLNCMNVEYDDGYGTQVIFGTIWYTDGSWSSRGEYDGSEWWEFNTCPEIPEHLTELIAVTPIAEIE